MNNFFVVEKLNFFTFILSLILKGFNFKTFYISSSGRFLIPHIFHKLRRIGIKTVEQDDFYPHMYADFFQRTYELSLIELAEFKKSNFIINARQFFIGPLDQESQNKLDVLLLTELEKKLYITGKLLVVADTLKKRHPESLIIISYAPLYSNLLKGRFPNFSLPFYQYLSIFPLIGYFFQKLFLKRIHRYQVSKNKTEFEPVTEKLPEQSPFNAELYQVAYFPHEGIFYGSLFKKDFYYSSKKDSPLHQSRILHLSLNDSSINYENSKKYYIANNIPFYDLFQFPNVSPKKVATMVVRKLFSPIFIELLSCGPHSLFLKLKVFFKIQLYHEYIKNLKNLKLALITMETEFPQELSLALSIRGIQIVSVQDRLLLPFGPNCTTILDHYFVFGNFVKEYLEKHQDRFYTKRVYALGNIKSDHLYNYQQDIPVKYKEIKNNSKIVLILDFLMSQDFVSSHFHDEANWANGIKFYQDIYKLACEFPSIHFVLKGKNNSNYSIPEFIPYFKKLETLCNFTIEKDLEIYQPHVLGKIADAALCLYTSMADELLAIGTPVFIYDYCGLPGKYFDSPASCTNYDELIIKFKRWYDESYFMDKQAFNDFVNYYYSHSTTGPVRPQLEIELEKIIQSLEI